MPLVLIHTGIVKYLWQILILYSIQFAYPTYSGSPFSDIIAIMIRHYVIHPYLKIRHYVIHPTNCCKIARQVTLGHWLNGLNGNLRELPLLFAITHEWLKVDTLYWKGSPSIHRDPIKMHPFCLGLYFKKWLIKMKNHFIITISRVLSFMGEILSKIRLFVLGKSRIL